MIITSEKCPCGARVLPQRHCEKCGKICKSVSTAEPFKLTHPAGGPGDTSIILPKHAVYNARTSEGRKIIILDQMSKKHTQWLKVGRSVARQVARNKGTVTAEDVRVRLEANDIFPRHRNAYGALFRASEFEFTGNWAKSTVVSHHASDLRVWRLA